MVLLPLIQTVFFNIACGHDPKNLSLGILNEEFIGNSSDTCSITQAKHCFLDGGVTVSCLVLERLKEKTFDLVIQTDIFNQQIILLIKTLIIFLLITYPTQISHN